MYFSADKLNQQAPDVQRKIANNSFFNNSGEGYFFSSRDHQSAKTERHDGASMSPADAGAGEKMEQPVQTIPAQVQDNHPADQMTANPVVGSIKLVKDPSDKPVSGFQPALCCAADENTPGPFNDAVKGPVANSHQVHFTLSAGKSDDLSVVRMIKRTSTRAGQNFDKKGNDGPPADEIKRPNQQTLVVADIPGWCVGAPAKATPLCGPAMQNSDFPLTYNADFVLAVFDPLTLKTSSINYQVNINKTSISDAAPKNEVVEKGQKL